MDLENFEIDKASENEIEEYISNLTLEKDNLASQGQYLEADKIKKKLKELKDELSNQKKSNLTSQHGSELQQLEESYLNEIFTFNQEWDQKLNFFNQSAKDSEQEINQRHEQELEVFIKKEEEKLPKIVKFSAECLNNKKIENQLVKMERYEEAYFYKVKREKMEKSETEKFEKENSEKLKIKCDVLTQKQNLERNALRQKLDTEFEIMKKQKETELAKIILKYKNKRKDLEWLQKTQTYQSEQKLSKAKNALTVNNFNNNFYKSNSMLKIKSYPTEVNKSSPQRGTAGNSKKNGVRYSSEKSPRTLKGKKSAGNRNKVLDTDKNNEDGQEYQDEEQNGENNDYENKSRTLEEHVDAVKEKQSEHRQSNKNFNDEIYQQYDNNLLPQENENEFDPENDQGREVAVENDEI